MPWEKKFDETVALDRAGNAFWTGGYEATSMNDLLEQMGIQKGSFYATYGCKHRVLLESLRAYVQKNASFFAEIAQSPTPRASLENHLRQVASQACEPNGNRGCYVINMALELAPKDDEVRKLSRESLENHEASYVQILNAAKSKHEIAEDVDTRQLARGLLAMVLGMQVLARSSSSAEMIMGVADQAIRSLGPRFSKKK